MDVATPTQHRATTSGERYRRGLQKKTDISRVPVPKYRHAAPSAPWPWMDFEIDHSEVQPASPTPSNNSAWGQYPQSLFRNWTEEQVNRSQMLTKCGSSEESTVYKFDVFNDGEFAKRVETLKIHTDSVNLQAYWHYLRNDPPSNSRVQLLFIKDMSPSVLQILGTKFNIEPFFFASSVNWIPSRYREDPKPLEDHITVILPFIRILKRQTQRPIMRTEPFRAPTSTSVSSHGVVEQPLPYMAEKHTIDTQAALSLLDDKFIHQDLLSLHMVRKPTTSTIISCHPASLGTSAERLQCLVQRTGDSVYWSKIFKRSKDPTFLLLAMLWYALYAWDEAFEVLYHYISALEHKVLRLFNDIEPTQELHKLQAHLLHYQQLLQEFHRSVTFVRDMPSPAMNADGISQAEREGSRKLLRVEADNLISQIERLGRQREMLFDRLKNVIQMVLTVATVNMEDSKAMQELAETCAKESTAIKQISYFAIFFLPAQFLSNVFSMNVCEINPGNSDHPIKLHLAYYIAYAIGLTLLTSWLAVAIRRDLHQTNSSVLQRTLWPFIYLYGVVSMINMPASRHPPPAAQPSGEDTHRHVTV